MACLTIGLVMSLAGYKPELIASGMLTSGNANAILWIMAFVLPALAYFLTQLIVRVIARLHASNQRHLAHQTQARQAQLVDTHVHAPSHD